MDALVRVAPPDDITSPRCHQTGNVDRVVIAVFADGCGDPRDATGRRAKRVIDESR
jgi:hypothetical protein